VPAGHRRPHLHGLAVTHITGYLYALVMPAVTGAAVILQDVWDPRRAADLIEARACRFSVGATPFLHGLVEEYERRGGRRH
jgi:cyclohexanecarboxylate-CoA ligase